MSPALPAPRADIFRLIHKALRARLARLLVDAGRLDPADDAEVAGLLADLRDTLVLCLRHLELEEKFILPALEARRPGATRHARREHQQHLSALEQLSALALRLEFLPALRRAPVVAELYQALAGHLAHDLEHMALEELELNRALQETHTDGEIHAIEQALRADLTPAESALSLRSLLPALNAPERATLLAGLQAAAPPEALTAALAAARAVLGEHDLYKLESALGLERRPADFVGLA